MLTGPQEPAWRADEEAHEALDKLQSHCQAVWPRTVSVQCPSSQDRGVRAGHQVEQTCSSLSPSHGFPVASLCSRRHQRMSQWRLDCLGQLFLWLTSESNASTSVLDMLLKFETSTGLWNPLKARSQIFFAHAEGFDLGIGKYF